MDGLNSQFHRYQCFIDPTYVVLRLSHVPEPRLTHGQTTEIDNCGDPHSGAGTRSNSFALMLRTRINERD